MADDEAISIRDYHARHKTWRARNDKKKLSLRGSHRETKQSQIPLKPLHLLQNASKHFCSIKSLLYASKPSENPKILLFLRNGETVTRRNGNENACPELVEGKQSQSEITTPAVRVLVMTKRKCHLRPLTVRMF